MRRLVAPALVALAFIVAAYAWADGIAGHMRVTPDRGNLAYTSVTHSSAGTADTVLTTIKDSVLLALENTTDVEVMITIGTTNFKRVPAASFRVLDPKTDGVAFGPAAYKVYYTGSAPTLGNVEIVALPFR